MPFALITIGLIFFLSALNTVNGQPAYKALSTQLYSDIFTSSPSFIKWALALVAVGFIGYIPGAKKPADWFMFLIIIGMVLANGGFFTQLESAIQSGPTAAGATVTAGATSGTNNPITLFNNIVNGGLGLIPGTTQNNINNNADVFNNPNSLAGAAGTPDFSLLPNDTFDLAP